MNSNRIVCFIVFLSSFLIHSQTIPIYKTTHAPIIDGDLSDWKTPFIGPFVKHNSGEKATQATYISLSWDSKNLYLAYDCKDTKIVGSAKKHDYPIYESDDLVEFFLDPDGNSKNYIEIGANAFSTNYDLIINCTTEACGGWKSDLSFDISQMVTASKINEDGYCVEIKIPFSSLAKLKKDGFSVPKVNTKWKGNVFRIDYGNETEYLAITAYTSSQFGFHQPEEFKTFEFKDVYKK